MLLGLARLGLVLFVVQSVVYGSLYFYLRAGLKMRLVEEWAARGPSQGAEEHRDDWIDARMAPRLEKLRLRLAIWVYVVPMLGLITFVIASNS